MIFCLTVCTTSSYLQSSSQPTNLALLLTSYTKMAWRMTSIDLSVTTHSKKSLPRFQVGLWKLIANQTEFVLPTALIDNPAWDMFDSDLLNDNLCWFHSLIQEEILLAGITTSKLIILHFLLLVHLQLALLYLIQIILTNLSQHNISTPTILTSRTLLRTPTQLAKTPRAKSFVAVHCNQWPHQYWQTGLSCLFFYQAQCQTWLAY